MKLSLMVKQQAALMDEVTVEMDKLHGWVTISSEGEDDIFLQDSEGSEFIDEVKQVWKECGDVTEDEAALYVAAPYVDSFWS
jgi:hypothetical protein